METGGGLLGKERQPAPFLFLPVQPFALRALLADVH